MDAVIEELTSAEGFREAYPVMEQLRPIPEAEYLALLAARRGDGYRLFALRDGGDDGDGAAGPIRALAGLSVETNFDHGRHVWVHDLVVDEAHRSRGYGARFLAWVEDWAEDRDCTCVELASGLWRERAHEFYEGNGFERYCYTFRSDLPAESPY